MLFFTDTEWIDVEMQGALSLEAHKVIKPRHDLEILGKTNLGRRSGTDLCTLSWISSRS